MKTESIQGKNENRYGWIAFMLLQAGLFFGQQSYDNFEGNTLVNYDTKKAGKLKLSENPLQDAVNASSKCAKYTRSNKPYDNIKIHPSGKFMEVNQFASYAPQPPCLRMKVYTTAPVGTPIELQLGKRSEVKNPYPTGTHSQYMAYTTVSGAWEELEFKFTEVPQGSKTTKEEVDQIIVLFNPNSKKKDVFYFDDMCGPPVTETVTQKK